MNWNCFAARGLPASGALGPDALKLGLLAPGVLAPGAFGLGVLAPGVLAPGVLTPDAVTPGPPNRRRSLTMSPPAPAHRRRQRR